MILGIYGAGGQGMDNENLAEAINEQEHRWDGYVFIDDDPAKNGKTVADLPVMNFEQALATYGKDGIEVILAVGEPVIRDIVFKKVREAGCVITNLIHPDVRAVRTFTYGNGLVVHKGNDLPPCSHFGNNVLLQGKTYIGHTVEIGDNVVVSAFAFIGGDVKIGRNAYIGPSCCIRNAVNIGENAIIGMGAVVTKDVPDNAVVYGNPAQIMRYNEKGRVFSK